LFHFLEDKTPMASTVEQVVKMMSAKAIQPSPLKCALKVPELMKSEINLCWELGYSLGKCKDSHVYDFLMHSCMYQLKN